MSLEPAEPPDRSGRLRASDADREQVVTTLNAAMAAGQLDLGELEERVGAAYAARTLGELAPLTEDLPVPAPAGAPVAPGVRGSATSFALMSETTRRGAWVVPAAHGSTAVMGSVVLDLRRARFTAAHTTITAVALMGSVEVLVDESLVVDVTGVGLLGTFEDRSAPPGSRSEVVPASRPSVTVRGLALMGSVLVRHAGADDEG